MVPSARAGGSEASLRQTARIGKSLAAMAALSAFAGGPVLAQPLDGATAVAMNFCLSGGTAVRPRYRHDQRDRGRNQRSGGGRCRTGVLYPANAELGRNGRFLLFFTGRERWPGELVRTASASAARPATRKTDP